MYPIFKVVFRDPNTGQLRKRQKLTDSRCHPRIIEMDYLEGPLSGPNDHLSELYITL